MNWVYAEVIRMTFNLTLDSCNGRLCPLISVLPVLVNTPRRPISSFDEDLTFY